MEKILFCIALFSVCACSRGEAKTAAEVNGTTVSASAVEKRMWSIVGERTVNDLISEELVFQQAKTLGVTVSSGEVENVFLAEKGQGKAAQDFVASLSARFMSEDDERYNVRVRLLSRALTVKMLGLQVADGEVEAFFKENRARFDKPEGQLLLQLTTATKQEAQDMLTALAAGTEFSKLAIAKCSANKLCPADASPVTVYRGQLGEAAEKVVFTTAPGMYSGVVENNGYYHVLKVLSPVPAAPADFGKMKDQLRDALLQSRIDQGVPVMLSQLRSAAKIKLYSR